MDVKLLCEELNVSDEKDLIRYKQNEKQVRVFAGKPEPLNLSSKECQKLCAAAGINYATGYEKRVLQYIVSNETKDRYGDVVKAEGGSFENYMNNPVMFFNHIYDTPIGNSLKVWIDKGKKAVQAWGLFMDNNIDTTGLSDLIFRMSDSGFLKACSVGFMPKEAIVPKNEDEAQKLGVDRWGAVFTKWDMLEWSPCGIPANPAALQNSLTTAKSLQVRKEDIDVFSKFKIFPDENLLDQFVEKAIKKSAPGFILPALNVRAGTDETVSREFEIELDEKEEEEETVSIDTPEPEVDEVESEETKNIDALQEESDEMEYVNIPKELYQKMVDKTFDESNLQDEITELKNMIKSLQDENKKITEKVNSFIPESKGLYEDRVPMFFSKPNI